MHQLSRRTALRVGGAALGAALAGCLATDGGPGGPGTTPSGDGTTTDRPDDPTTPQNDEVTATRPGIDAVRIRQTGVPLTPTDWAEDGPDTAGDLVLLDSAAAARAVLDPSRLPEDGRAAVEAFVAETDFDSAVLLHVASVAPNTCYTEVAVEDVRLDDSRLVGTARALDTSPPETACGEAITYPAALVRVTVDGPLPAEATMTITNGWGTEKAITATAAEPPATDPADLPGYVRPDGDPAVVPPALACDDGDFERHSAGFDEDELAWGETTDDDGEPAFALRVNDLAFDRGDEVRVSLTNVSAGERYTGNRRKFNLQVLTEAGWQDVRGYPADRNVGYTDEAVVHGPGEGFDWRFPLDAAGVLDPNDHDGLFEVCPDLPAGRYRFAFWEPAVAVAFDLVE